VARAAAKPPNDLQRSLSTAALLLPTLGADTGAHIARLGAVPDTAPSHASVGDAAEAVAAHIKAFLGR
ncbi:MAG: phospholipase, partial [Stellaceae bacterium]